MIYAFQDRENLYLVMDLMNGGDLRYHLGKNRRFNEEQTSLLFFKKIASISFFARIFHCMYCCWTRIYSWKWSVT